ncbi:peptidase inhibitor family I36 protein [Kitasatospora cineracea]|uniref:peptidase inhibitor family I36 protein n=1 Tax=Kitasatospora cineracea TaxID=88074 RepID=UPI000F500903|nr:peptidase inhibitor family I36 protein [Kitasatospora cineracea]
MTAPDALAASGDCASTDVCLFDNENYTGFMFARDAYWDQQVTTGGSECMNSSSRNSYVGWYDNDEASSIQVYTDAGAC